MEWQARWQTHGVNMKRWKKEKWHLTIICNEDGTCSITTKRGEIKTFVDLFNANEALNREYPL